MATDELPLVGRAAEVQVIADMLDALDGDGSGAFLQVAGEPGIGKSRLLRELSKAAHARGHLVLAGRAAEFEAELPFGIFNHALDDWLHSLGPEPLQSLADRLTARLAMVLPAFEQVAGDRPPELHQERYRAHRAVRGLLSALGATTPLVLVLDDVHWADPGSMELLSHLLAHPPQGAVLVALGFRPAQVPPRLAHALAGALREQDGRRLDLTPLSEPTAGELLDPGVPPAVRERLYRESGGNPFFLLQLARGVALATERPRKGSPLAASVPEPVLNALATELSSVSAPSLVLLQGAAMTGDPFDARLAAIAADVGEANALDLIDELVRFQLVHPTDVAGEFAFRHPIVRATVSELTASGWRTRAHARLAAVLAARGASASARAPHVERSADRGDAGAVAVLVEAGQSSASRAPALAARWYGAALHLLREGQGSEPQRIELLIARATALSGAGSLEESRRTLVELLERLPDGHPHRVPIVAFCAGVEHLLGRHRDADARLLRALRDMPDRTSAEAVQVMVELAAGAAYENRYDDMLRWAQQAFEAAAELGERALAVVAGGQLALGHYFLGRPAAHFIDRAATAMDALSDAELAGRLDIGLWIGWSEAVMERHEDAIEHCRRVIDVARATSQGAVLLVTTTAQAWSLIRSGRLAEAEEVLTGATEAGRLAPNLFLAVAVGLSGVVATYRGDHEVAVRAGEESVRLAQSADPGLIPGMSGLYQAIPLIEMGQAQRAREILLAMSGGCAELHTSRSGHAAAYEVLTRAELALGRLDAAEDWARRAEAATHGGDLVAEAACADRAQAAVALARGDAAGAARLMRDASARADEAGAPVEAGRCRILGARALLGAGQRGPAVAELQRAAEGLGRVGADGYRAEAEQELDRLRRRPPGQEMAGGAVGPGRSATDGAFQSTELRRSWGTLTRSERAVVELVAEGLSNPEVAERLFLSRHTVKRHLANAMLKLGLNSRVKLAREVSRFRS